MSPGAKSFLRRWFVTTIGVLVASNVVSGVQADNTAALLAASLVLGILNALLRPVMIILSLPLLIVTLGLFTFVINALLLYFVGALVNSFHVNGFWAAFKGGIVISIVSLLANALIGKSREVPPSPRVPPPPPTGKDVPGSGPIIDI